MVRHSAAYLLWGPVAALWGSTPLLAQQEEVAASAPDAPPHAGPLGVEAQQELVRPGRQHLPSAAWVQGGGAGLASQERPAGCVCVERERSRPTANQKHRDEKTIALSILSLQ